MLKRIKIKNIKPNPFRNIERYPIREDKVVALIESFKQTGIWPVILGRESGDYVEIPFGHHRKEAWDRSMKSTDSIEINIMPLSDTDMLKMMAHENMEEWGTTAIIEIETVAAVVQAYADGKIELNGVPTRTKGVVIRYAPSFISGSSTRSVDHPYSTESVAKFLGWIKPGGTPQQKVYVALSALELIEEGILTEDDFLELSSKQAESLVSEARARKEEREREARTHEQKAAEAEKQKEQAATYQERKAAEEFAEREKQKAQKARAYGKDEAQRIGKHLSGGMREGRIATRQARIEANKIVGLPKREKELRSINTAVRGVIGNLDDFLNGDNVQEKLRLLFIDAAYIDAGLREMLIGSLEALAERALNQAHKFNQVEIQKAKDDKRMLPNG